MLETKEIKECYFSVAFTDKGSQHIMNLNNGWQELIECYKPHAYIPIEELGDISDLPVFLNECGTFLNSSQNGGK